VDKSNVLINILIVLAIFLNFIIDIISFVWNRYLVSCLYPFHERTTSIGERSTFSDSSSSGLSMEGGKSAAVVMSALHVQQSQGSSVNKEGKEGYDRDKELDELSNSHDEDDDDVDDATRFSTYSRSTLTSEKPRERMSSVIEMASSVR